MIIYVQRYCQLRMSMLIFSILSYYCVNNWLMLNSVSSSKMSNSLASRIQGWFIILLDQWINWSVLGTSRQDVQKHDGEHEEKRSVLYSTSRYLPTIRIFSSYSQHVTSLEKSWLDSLGILLSTCEWTPVNCLRALQRHFPRKLFPLCLILFHYLPNFSFIGLSNNF